MTIYYKVTAVKLYQDMINMIQKRERMYTSCNLCNNIFLLYNCMKTIKKIKKQGKSKRTKRTNKKQDDQEQEDTIKNKKEEQCKKTMPLLKQPTREILRPF
jgi:amino acid permease